ncbi:MAG TPA: PadR family transcriptional regulator [Phycisphaerae bacterium]|nr:PadR family transcriptional regulator [Phycisphaerae bacterium]
MVHRRLLSGFVRLHILHHAATDALYGAWMTRELRRHGYRISPGTLYPMLHGLERAGYLRSWRAREHHRVRRVYRATAKGKAALRIARARLKELFNELFERD